MSEMQVWIDQDICTECAAGPDICYVIAPEVFFQGKDSLAYVKDPDDPTGLDSAGNPKNTYTDAVRVPQSLLPKVIKAAEECPGEIIMLERVKAAPATDSTVLQ